MNQVIKCTKNIPMTELQRAYYLGSSENTSLGGSYSRSYMELECDKYSASELQKAIEKLVRSHEMLHCSIKTDMHIEILENYSVNIEVTDFRTVNKPKESIISEIRDTIFSNISCIEHELPVKFYLSLFDKNLILIHIYGNGMVLDGWSHEILITELEDILDGNDIIPELGFCDYVNAYSDLEVSEKPFSIPDDLYKAEMVPNLPLKVMPSIIKKATDNQIDYYVPNKLWEKISNYASSKRISVFSILITIYGKVLELYSNNKNFLINIPRAKRPYWIDGAEHTIGMCSDFSIFNYNSTDSKSFSELTMLNHKKLIEMQDNSDASGMEITHNLQKIKGESTNIPITLTSTLGIDTRETKSLKKKYVKVHTSQVWLETFITQIDNSVIISMNFVKELFQPQVAENIARSFYDSVVELTENPAVWEGRTRISINNSDIKIIDKLNETKMTEKIPMFADRLIENMYTYSEKIAIGSEDESLTYSELNTYAYCLSEKIKKYITNNSLKVGIYLNKGWAQIVCAVAAMCSNAVYMPLDPDMTSAELDYCNKKVGLSCIITEHTLLNKVQEANIKGIIDFETINPVAGMFTKQRLVQDKEDIAIMINTSGTTGKPKSIMLSHEGINNCLYCSERIFGIKHSDSAIAVTNFCHDMAIFDTLGMFWCGGTVVVPSHEKQKDPRHWLNLMKKYQVTIWNSVPALMEMLLVSGYEGVNEVLKNLKVVIHGGDWLSAGLAKSILENNKSCNLYNVGGPTETTIWNIYHKVTLHDIKSNSIPYGRPFLNTKYFILNAHMDLCPLGVQGTMYVAGIGVSKGYVGLEEETVQKFVNYHGERVYNTGDQGKYLFDGTIEIMGRIDNQVKINGKRVELNGIESVINKIAGVISSAVIIHKKTKKLVCFYSAHYELDNGKILDYLKKKLSDYLIPQLIVYTDRLPITSNGKVDRKFLSNYEFPDEKKPVNTTSSAGRILVKIIKDVLDIDNIDYDDNFFALGGDSISAMKIVAKVEKELKVELSVYDILNQPIISGWIDTLENTSTIEEAAVGKQVCMEDILAIVRDILDNNCVCENDSFIEMGGNVSIAKKISKVIQEKWNLQVSPYHLVGNPYIEDWLNYIEVS
ncbi:AMP-binding protein [Lachnospiraceae bacterium ZAX-1]